MCCVAEDGIVVRGELGDLGCLSSTLPLRHLNGVHGAIIVLLTKYGWNWGLRSCTIGAFVKTGFELAVIILIYTGSK